MPHVSRWHKQQLCDWAIAQSRQPRRRHILPGVANEEVHEMNLPQPLPRPQEMHESIGVVAQSWRSRVQKAVVHADRGLEGSLNDELKPWRFQPRKTATCTSDDQLLCQSHCHDLSSKLAHRRVHVYPETQPSETGFVRVTGLQSFC